MKFKRFSDRDQAFLRGANDHGLDFALVIKAMDKDNEYEVIGAASAAGHLDTEDDEYESVYTPNLKGVNA